MFLGDNHSLFVQRVRKLDRTEAKRAKCGSVDSTPLLAEKFRHDSRSARKGRWSLAHPIAAYQVKENVRMIGLTLTLNG